MEQIHSCSHSLEDTLSWLTMSSVLQPYSIHLENCGLVHYLTHIWKFWIHSFTSARSIAPKAIRPSLSSYLSRAGRRDWYIPFPKRDRNQANVTNWRIRHWLLVSSIRTTILTPPWVFIHYMKEYQTWNRHL